MTNEPILQCIIVLNPGLFVTGFIQNERKLSSSGSFSFSSWQTNSLLVKLQMMLVVVTFGSSELGNFKVGDVLDCF